MSCQVCGSNYRAGATSCPQCGASTEQVPLADPAPPAQEDLPLRGLAQVLTVLLAVVIAVIVVRLGILWRWPGLGGLATEGAGGPVITWLDRIGNFAILSIAILFLIWFHRARIMAEGRGWEQRRARGWAFWGWIVPFVSLWIPLQIMGDIWRAGLPEAKRDRTAAWPALWWTCWLVGASQVVGLPYKVGQRARGLGLAPGTLTYILVATALAAVALIAIIRKVSSGPVGSPIPYLPDDVMLSDAGSSLD